MNGENMQQIGEPTGESFFDLDVLEDVDHPDVPDERMYLRREYSYSKSFTDLQVVCATIADDDFSTLLIGRHGVGKDEMILHIASRTNRPVIRIVGSDDPDFVNLLVGQYLPKGDGFEYEEGLLTKAIKNGYMFVIDEFNSLSGKVQTMLNLILEDSHKKRLTIPETNQVIEPHPEFRFVGTMNPDEVGYSGREMLDGATSSRFYPIRVPELDAKAEKTIVSAKSEWDVDNDDLEALLANDGPISSLRSLYDQNRITTWISTRDVIQIARMAERLGDAKTATSLILEGRASEEDRDAIETQINDLRW